MVRVLCLDSLGNSIDYFTQWDVNQTIYIDDWDYDFTPIFHFCNTKSKEALVVKGQIVGNQIKSSVPNILLQSAYPVIVFVYLENDTSGTSIYMSEIPVRHKPKPEDYEYTENIEYVSWVKLEAEAEEFIAQLKSDKEEYEKTLGTAKENADKASSSASSASASAAAAKTSENNAKSSATTATAQATNASNSATLAKSYAVGGTSTRTNEDVDNSKYYYQESLKNKNDSADSAISSRSYAIGDTSTRNNEAVDNAKYYYEQSKMIAEGLGGALLPMGTISFSELASVAKSTGYMYNIKDEFVTDATFKEGEGYIYPVGTNVYYTADNYWDCLAGATSSVAELSEVEAYLGI